jgi:hypothetical protein
VALVVVEYKVDIYKFFILYSRTLCRRSVKVFSLTVCVRSARTATSTTRRKAWANARSRDRASSGIAVQRPCLGAGFPRE